MTVVAFGNFPWSNFQWYFGIWFHITPIKFNSLSSFQYNSITNSIRIDTLHRNRSWQLTQPYRHFLPQCRALYGQFLILSNPRFYSFRPFLMHCIHLTSFVSYVLADDIEFHLLWAHNFGLNSHRRSKFDLENISVINVVQGLCFRGTACCIYMTYVHLHLDEMNVKCYETIFNCLPRIISTGKLFPGT